MPDACNRAGRIPLPANPFVMETIARRRCPRALIAAAALVLPACLLIAAPVASALPRATYVTMSSDKGDWVGQGIASRVWEEHSASVTVSGDLSWLTVRVAGGSSGETYRLEFAAPPGEQLRPGLYRSVQRAAFRQPGHGGLDVHGEGRGCNTVAGQFDVKELVTSAAGNVKRLWITYVQHCDRGVPAMFGEVQLAMARPAGVFVKLADLYFPSLDLGASSSVVPVTVLNFEDTAVPIAHATVDGEMRADFPEVADNCSGVFIQPGETCQVWIRFIPGGAGPRHARLQLTDGAGRIFGPVLWGEGIGGTTHLWFGGPPGERISKGLNWSYRPGQAEFSTRFSYRNHVSMYLNGVDRRVWHLDFYAPAGQSELTPGTYTGTGRYPDYGFRIAGDGRACNASPSKFTVTDIAFDPDDVLLRFGATFEMWCEGRPDAVSGGLEYRLPTGDVTAPEPVERVRVTRTANTAKVSWDNPADPDYVRTIVRWTYGTTPPGGPVSGRLLYAGASRSWFRMTASSARDVSVAAFAVDAAGNVSHAATALAPGRRHDPD